MLRSNMILSVLYLADTDGHISQLIAQHVRLQSLKKGSTGKRVQQESLPHLCRQREEDCRS